MGRPKNQPKKTDEQIRQDKTQSLMNLIAMKAAYYRSNPHRFVEEVLGIHLKLFQKILFWALNFYNYFFYIAARGQGKTYLIALFCAVRAILYPGSKIVVCSYTRKQGNEVLLKIQDDFIKNSPILASEIEKCNISQNDAAIYFKNHSWIRVATASDSGRGMRANVLVVDESRMVDRNTILTVLRKFLTAARQPRYLDKKKYSHLQERNKEIYMSSAYYQDSEMYEQAQAYTAAFLDDSKKYFICGLPYQVSIKEGLLSRDQVSDEMSESTFSDISWMMEMDALFYGAGDESLFSYSNLISRRILSEPFYPLEVYKMNNMKVPDLVKGEERILSVDVALLASKKHDNDAAALIVNSSFPLSESGCISNIVYIETKEGLVTDDLGLLVMRFFYQYKCTQIALDATGIGQAILDYIMKDRYDPLYGVTYPALNCINNPDMAARCKVKNAPKVIWAIKANSSLNNDMCLGLRSGFQNGNINLLISESGAEAFLSKKIKGFSKKTPQEQVMYRLPYIQTTLLIEELCRLEHENKGGNIKVKERPGMRKDRYSSIEYSHYVAQQIAIKNRRKPVETESLVKKLPIKRAKRFNNH